MRRVDVAVLYNEHAEGTEMNDIVRMLEHRGYAVLATTNFGSIMSAISLKGARDVVTYYIDGLQRTTLSSVLKNKAETQNIFIADIYSEAIQAGVIGDVEYRAPDVEYKAPMGPKKKDLVISIDEHLKKTLQRDIMWDELEKRLREIKW